MTFQVGDRVRTSTKRLMVHDSRGALYSPNGVIYPVEMKDLFDRDATVIKVHEHGEPGRVYRLDIAGDAWYFDEMALELIEEATSFDGWEELI